MEQVGVKIMSWSTSQWAMGNAVTLARSHTPALPIAQLGYGFPPNRSLGNGGGQPPIAHCPTNANTGQCRAMGDKNNVLTSKK